jgi:hypothetical protein
MTGPFADATLTALPVTELLFWTVTFVVLAVLLWRVRDRKLDLPRVPLLILASFFWPVISFLTLTMITWRSNPVRVCLLHSWPVRELKPWRHWRSCF